MDRAVHAAAAEQGAFAAFTIASTRCSVRSPSTRTMRGMRSIVGRSNRLSRREPVRRSALRGRAIGQGRHPPAVRVRAGRGRQRVERRTGRAVAGCRRLRGRPTPGTHGSGPQALLAAEGVEGRSCGRTGIADPPCRSPTAIPPADRVLRARRRRTGRRVGRANARRRACDGNAVAGSRSRAPCHGVRPTRAIGTSSRRRAAAASASRWIPRGRACASPSRRSPTS